jgi:hypothetical protein
MSWVLRKNYILTDKNVSDSAPIEKYLYFYSDKRPDKFLINQAMNNLSLLKASEFHLLLKYRLTIDTKDISPIGDIRML